MVLSWAETIVDLEQNVVAFGRDMIEPHAERWEAAGTVPRSFFLTAAELGLCRLRVPQDQGGLGLSAHTTMKLLTLLAAHCMAATFALFVHNNLAASIAASRREQHQARFLGPMMKGEMIGAFLLTEPQAGSDAAALATTAQRTKTGWTLDGEKMWVTNAQLADVLCVYAQTDAQRNTGGIASFLVDAAHAGVSRTTRYSLLGGHGLGTAGFVFSACRLKEKQLFAAPGDAFRAAMAAIDLARVGVAAMCCGMVARALHEALQYLETRHAFGRKITDFQGIQWRLADVATDLEAARGLIARACALLDDDQSATLAAAQAKKFATDIALRRLSDCMQCMGAQGLSREYPFARHLEMAKIAQYLDGTSEIQNLVIARMLAKHY